MKEELTNSTEMIATFGKIVSVESDGLVHTRPSPTCDDKYPVAVLVCIESAREMLGNFEILGGTRVTPFLKAGAGANCHSPEKIENVIKDGKAIGYRATYRMYLTNVNGDVQRVKRED